MVDKEPKNKKLKIKLENKVEKEEEKPQLMKESNESRTTRSGKKKAQVQFENFLYSSFVQVIKRSLANENIVFLV